VAGGFHAGGGMDKANLALGQYLVEQGTPVHVVSQNVDAGFASHPLVTVYRVPKLAGSFLLTRPLLDFKARSVARAVSGRWPDTRVLVNGDSCLWPGINWVHYVHHAWTPEMREGPLWLRTKQRLGTWLSRKREKSAARIGRVFVTNSQRTSKSLIELLGVSPEQVHTVYLGAESEWGPITGVERSQSRKRLGIPEGRLSAVFVGALGFDHRKGFDILFDAWKILCASPDWDVDLMVAGNGTALPMWRRKVSEHGLVERIRFLGFTDRIDEFLASADLLVSPTRYEAYGLNVQEAICRGLPAIVSSEAGVAERYSQEFEPLLLTDTENRQELVSALRMWRSNPDHWKASFQQFGTRLRQYGWKDMASRIVLIANSEQAARI